MEKPAQNNLLELIDRMRSLVPPEQSNPDCDTIDWTVPRHYGADERTVLADFSVKLAVHLQKVFHAFCDDTAEVSFTEINEHFTSLLFPVLNQDRKNYIYLKIDRPETGCIGFLEIPFDSCTKLVGMMLKNPDIEIGQDGELSSLEESILMDVAGPMVDSLIEGLTQYIPVKLHSGNILVKGDEMDRLDQRDDMCQLSFCVSKESAQFPLSVYLLDELLDPMVGIVSIDRSPDHLRKMPDRVISRMQDVHLDVSARLSTGMIHLQDILMLRPDDVLLLDRKVNMTADVLVNGKHCFDAWPSQQEGHGAMVIAGQITNESIH